MILTSPAFNTGDPIPVLHTCDGKDFSPRLSWSGVPANTSTLALICDDPDAPGGTWVHWVLFNVPARETGLSENQLKTPTLPNGARQGINDFRRLGYGGPCPPRGTSHRYFFRLFALSKELSLDPGCAKVDLERAMKGLILAEAQLMGTYERPTGSHG